MTDEDGESVQPAEIERVPTGIDGLDAVLGGGIVRNATVLVTGTPGTGKSILGMEYLYRGVEEFDERGIYVSFEENAEDIAAAAESIGFTDWRAHVEADQIVVYDKRELLREEDFVTTIDRLLETVTGDRFQRLVMDSLTMFQLFFESEQEQRSYLLKLSDILKSNGLTSLLINERSTDLPRNQATLEHFLTDGNIHLIQTPEQGETNRYLWVSKMRKQRIRNQVFPMAIRSGGITVFESAADFSMMGDADFEDFT